jgi:MFS family permease
MKTDPVRWRLGLAVVVDSTGTGLFLAVSTIYLTRHVGLSGGQVGLGLGAAALVGLATVVPLGRLADQRGARPVYVALQCYRAAVFAGYPLVNSFGSFLLVACLAGAAEGAIVPVLQTMVADVYGPSARVGAMALLRSVQNVGFGLGAVAATAALIDDTRAAYQVLLLLDSISFLIAAVVVARLRTSRYESNAGPDKTGQRDTDRGGVEQTASKPAAALDRRVSSAFLATSLLNGLLSVHMVILGVGLPLWLASATSAPVALNGPLLALNTVLAGTLQVRLSRRADASGGARALFVRTGLALACCCGTLAASGLVRNVVAVSALLVVAVVALTLGEIWQAAAQWGVAYELAPAARRGSRLALFSLGGNLRRVVGPLLISAVIAAGGAGWLLLGAMLLVAGFAATGMARTAARQEGLPIASGEKTMIPAEDLVTGAGLESEE